MFNTPVIGRTESVTIISCEDVKKVLTLISKRDKTKNYKVQNVDNVNYFSKYFILGVTVKISLFIAIIFSPSFND